MHFFISTQRYVRGYQKVAHAKKKNHKNIKKYRQIAIFSSKGIIESLNSFTVFNIFTQG